MLSTAVEAVQKNTRAKDPGQKGKKALYQLGRFLYIISQVKICVCVFAHQGFEGTGVSVEEVSGAQGTLLSSEGLQELPQWL